MQTEFNNFWNTIEHVNRPLICFREGGEGSGSPSFGDAIASSLALASTLTKLGKQVEIVSTGFSPSGVFEFLGAHIEIKSNIEALRKFVISLDISKNKINDFSYDIVDDKLHIYLTPKNGIFEDKAVETRHENFKYDAVIAVDTPSLQALGALYAKNPDLFFNMPIINIDHSPMNEFFGQVNVVDLGASSTAEVIAELLKHKRIQVDGDLATKILAGIIAKTKSFKNLNLSPKTLQLASRLLELGAHRDEIIQNFYRTRSIETLKLWGRALARLKAAPEIKLVWSVLGREDFMQAGATSDAELSDVIHELITSSPGAEVIVLLYEQKDKNICALLAVAHGRDAREIGKIFNADGTREMVTFCLPGVHIVEAEKDVIGKLKERLK